MGRAAIGGLANEVAVVVVGDVIGGLGFDVDIILGVLAWTVAPGVVGAPPGLATFARPAVAAAYDIFGGAGPSPGLAEVGDVGLTGEVGTLSLVLEELLPLKILEVPSLDGPLPCAAEAFCAASCTECVPAARSARPTAPCAPECW